MDVGELGERIVCAGIKQYYKKDNLVGKKVIVFINLAPRVMKGIESQGMILAAVNREKDKVVLIKPKQEIDNGMEVKFKNG